MLKQNRMSFPLDEELELNLDAFCRLRKLTKSEVIRASLQLVLNDESLKERIIEVTMTNEGN